ncbi:DUF3039 domain-containing protein [Clavibacter phaseoli]|uniref:DUF3039 domain-containing protein n=1 Tax=Clavibacter phaseoli TaxID=1734031 RepID=UPI001F315CC5|nr:DUF3039 domain-containing protein [Clavibacter phaseoli]
MTEDLVADWASIEHHRAALDLRAIVKAAQQGGARRSDVARQIRSLPRLHLFAHPIISSFSSAFAAEGSEVARESVSGLKNPHWWKQKSTRWRGAATDHSLVGTDQVWLCGAGIRAAGEDRDFYSSFMQTITRSGPEAFLPNAEDKLLQKIDKQVSSLDGWKVSLHGAILVLLSTCVDALAHGYDACAGPVDIPSSDPERPDDVVARVELSISRETVGDEDLIEAFLTVAVVDRADVLEADLASQLARAALQPHAEEWRQTPYVGDSFAYSALIDQSTLSKANTLRSTGVLSPDESPDGLLLGVHAHYATESRLVDAQVEGAAVRALCGYWFVPTADHTGLETCAKCVDRHAALPI